MCSICTTVSSVQERRERNSTDSTFEIIDEEPVGYTLSAQIFESTIRTSVPNRSDAKTHFKEEDTETEETYLFNLLKIIVKSGSQDTQYLASYSVYVT